MIDLSHQHFSADKARALLRRLRDLNLSTGPIAVRANLSAFLAGCSSLDAPAESGVRYRVRIQDGVEMLMQLAWTGSGLELAIVGTGVPVRFGPSATDANTTPAKMCVPITCDRKGRACAPKLGARVSPESTDERQLEHFLRRAVRTLLR